MKKIILQAVDPINNKAWLKSICSVCNKANTIQMTVNQMNRYYDGKELVQTIFPEKSASEREMLVSGICSDCWDKMFS